MKFMGRAGINRKTLLFTLVLFFLFSPFFLAAQEDDGIVRALREINAPYEERPLLRDYGGFGSSVHVRLSAAGNEEGSAFVLAVPRGKAYAVETALSFIKTAIARDSVNRKADLLIAFLGDEENRLPRDAGGFSHKGLRDLLSLPDMPETWILCYMDFETAPGKVLLSIGNDDYIAPLAMVSPLPPLFRSRAIDADFEIRYNELYKLGLVRGHEELALAWETEINSIYLSGEYRKGAKSPAPEDLADLLFEYSEGLNFPIQNPDRYYSFVSIPGFGNMGFFSETTAVLILLLMAALFIFSTLIYTAAYRAVFYFNIRLFIRHAWIFIIFFPLLVLILQGSGFFYSLLLKLFGRPVPSFDFPGAGLTVLLAVWLLYIPFHLLDIFHIPKKQNFYGASALILAGMGLIIAGILDFSYIPVFLWAFIFTFLGAFLRNPLAIIISALFIPLQAAGALYNLVESSNGTLARVFLNSANPGSWAASAQIAVLSLPFILLLKRGVVLFNKERRSSPRRIVMPLRFRIGFITVVLISMVIHVLFLPKTIPEQIRRFGTQGAAISLKDTIFRESRIVEVQLEAPGKPVRFDLFLEAHSTSPLVYSAPCPFISVNDKTIAFILGENPPNPFTVEIVVPGELTGKFTVIAVYDSYDPSLDPDRDPETGDYILRIVGNADITS